MTRLPRIPIAKPQLGSIPGTWAYSTIKTRFKGILKTILDGNDFNPEINSNIKCLMEEIPNGKIRNISGNDAPDIPVWNNYIKPHLGKNWFQPPWFFTEHYFYRRILEASKYFREQDNSRIDPFYFQKQKGLLSAKQEINYLWNNLINWQKSGINLAEILRKIILIDLWGNQADLSLWPAENKSKPDHKNPLTASTHILINDIDQLITFLLNKGTGNRIDFLIDNAGFELICDLIFSDTLIKNKLTKEIRFHVKKHPTYVSDAISKDIYFSINYLLNDIDAETRQAGKRLSLAVERGTLQIKSNWFWNSPLDGWSWNSDLREELSQADLVISKGDANYRRLLGDRHWHFTTPFQDIISYFPSSLTALRTLKSELAVGFTENQVANVTEEDPNWLIDGRWAILQTKLEELGEKSVNV